MSTGKSTSLLETIQTKINDLLAEFRQGAIGREQFNVIYTRYHGQLNLAIQVADQELDDKSKDPSTFNIQDLRKEKALAVIIFQNQTHKLIEKIGQSDLSDEVIASFLTEDDQPIIQKIDDAHWLVLLTGDYTTARVLFANEVSELQMKSLKRIMIDFERANRVLLEKNEIESNKLAQPFVAVLKRSK